MLVQASSLQNNRIQSLEDQQTVGKISDIVVDPDNGQILGLVITSFMAKPRVLSPLDVVGFSPDLVAIKNKDVVLDLSEIVRADKVWKQKIRLINSVCKTESGKFLGWVEDYVIDLDTMTVIKYYVNGQRLLSFGPGRIILADHTVSIKPGLVIVEDDEDQTTRKAPAKAVSKISG
jgi:uncharacterized protein YrrD